MEVKKKNPELRFTGFTDDWREHRLGDLIDITSAARVHKNEWTKCGVPFFRSSDVVSAYKGTDNTKAYISQELYDELSNKIGKVQRNDILVTGGGSIGIPYLIKNNDPLYFKDADLLWLKNDNKINGQFLYEFFSTKTFRKYVEKITHIGTISHYTVEQAKGTPISLPCPDEQKRLGDFIANVNNLLHTHQKKHNRLVTLKISMLEKMFPKEGQAVPEIRFKGFKGDWIKSELENLGDFFKGKGLSKNVVSSKGKYKCLLYGHLFTEYGMIITKVNFSTNAEFEPQVLSKAGDVFIPCSSTTPTGIEKATSIESDGVIIGGDINVIRPNETILGSFLSINLNANGHKIIPLIKGITVRHLDIPDLKTVQVYFPANIKEQEKITTYFKKIDILINNHQKQLKKLKKIKQSLSEKMFV